jgi:hypothetical protein
VLILLISYMQCGNATIVKGRVLRVLFVTFRALDGSVAHLAGELVESGIVAVQDMLRSLEGGVATATPHVPAHAVNWLPQLLRKPLPQLFGILAPSWNAIGEGATCPTLHDSASDLACIGSCSGFGVRGGGDS